MKISFVVPGPPVPWERAGKARNKKTGKTIFYTKTASADAQERIKVCATIAAYRLKATWNAHGKSYGMTLHFFLPDKRTRDWDNLAKQVSDALNKVLYADDRLIDDVVIRKRIDSANPRTEVELEVLLP